MSEQRNDNIIIQTLQSTFHVVAGYLRAQLIMFAVNFAAITVSLWLFGIPLPALIALGICLLDIVPVVGSGLVFVPWSAVCFFTGRTTLGWQLALLYIALVALRQILEPLITGKNIGLHPLISFAASILGFFIFGAVGMIIGPLVAAILSSVYRLRTRKAAEISRQET